MTAPLVKLANAILFSAIKKSAEEFRIRPDGVVEFLINGETKEEMQLPADLYAHVIRRMSVMASLPVYPKGDCAFGRFNLLVGKLSYYFEVVVRGHGPDLTLRGRVITDAEFSGPYR